LSFFPSQDLVQHVAALCFLSRPGTAADPSCPISIENSVTAAAEFHPVHLPGIIFASLLNDKNPMNTMSNDSFALGKQTAPGYPGLTLKRREALRKVKADGGR